MKRVSYFVLLALVISAPLSALYAQQAQTQQTTVAPPPVTTPSPTSLARPDYRVGPDDAIKVDFIGIARDDSDLNQVYPVLSNGAIEGRLIGSVKVEGLTPLEIAKLLGDRMVELGLYGPGVVRPSVTMAVYRNFEVQVNGAVRTPGVVRLSGGDSSVNRAISQAGSYASNAGTEVEIFRAAVPGQPVKVITITREQLDMNDDPGLSEGDRVNVKIGQMFSVNGEVNAKGERPWSPGMTVQKALVLAGGQTDKFSLGRSHISRPEKNKDGSVKKYNKIKNLKLETPLQPDDILVAGRKWM